MQLTFLKSIMQPSDGLQKLTSMTWASNNAKLAAVTTERVVLLFDNEGERKDRFKTKPAEATSTANYVVRAMAFSPDSTKLAVAQSDNIVFVYKLGDGWGDKKSVCNKFLQSAAITCLVWPRNKDEVVFGLADGSVKLGQVKNNKAFKLYSHPEGSYVVSLACNPSGSALVVGHLDGSIYRFTFPDDEGGAGMASTQLISHSCVPYALGWGATIATGGNDSRVVFFDTNGKEVTAFDYSSEDSVREFTSCAFNPSGDTAVFGTYHRFYVYTHSVAKNMWEQVCMKHVDNFYAVTALAWKPDGSKLCVGSMTGALDMYDVCLKKHQYKGKFEFTYVSKSSVIVKELRSGKRIVLKSAYGLEIDRINIFKDRYLIARTVDTLLMGDLEACKLSEIPWHGDGTEKYIFDSETVCIVYWAGEMTIVAYDRNEVLGTCRTEHVHPTLLSVVAQQGMVQDYRTGGQPEQHTTVARLAYLVDPQTIRVMDLLTNCTLATINHDTRIDWLELNHRGTHLLFRDKKRHLSLFDLAKQDKVTLLNYTGYVQWVPQSDVVVAQSRDNLCVWYSINTPEHKSMFPIKGELKDIERNNNRTEVIVDDGINEVSYRLDEQLIEALTLIQFGAAMGEQNFDRAVHVLEPLELTPETEAQWMELSESALHNNQVVIAERCFAALGDITRTRYLHRVVKQAQRAAAEYGGSGYDSYTVRALLAQLGKNWAEAEALLLAQARVDECITMYQEAYKWEDALRVAAANKHPELDSLQSRYYKWLMETGQEEKAGLVKEQEGDYLGAIGLYLKGGLPARAAQVVMTYHVSHDPPLLQSILSSLAKAGLQERAGELYEYLGRNEEALRAYRQGHAFQKAIKLARCEYPATVVVVEEEWGDWLMVQKAMDAAINHFIEAGQTLKAMEAAFQCRQFPKAAGLIDFLDPGQALPYYKRIAAHYESIGNLEEAERYFIKAGLALDAVDMYSRAGKWEAAQKVARGYLSDKEMHALYLNKAREFEATHKFKDAEKAYLQGDEVDLAINMYKKARMYDQMMRLVSQYRQESLCQAHMLVAQALQKEGNLREAEKHYTDAKDWKAAVQMYRAEGSWEDALRVAKVYGGPNAAKQVAYAWAVTLGGDEGANLLRKMGMLEAAIDYATEIGAFAQAFELCRGGAKQKLVDVHYKYAMFLEDEGRFAEAEQAFVAAGKPKEAIDMYTHAQDWDSAMRIAEQYDPTSISDVLVSQANGAAGRKQLQVAEALFLKAKRPELALSMYREMRQWHDALRLAEDYLPGKVQEIQMELASGMASGPAMPVSGPDSIITKARKFEQGNDYARAIETYLSIGPADTDNVDVLEQCWVKAAELAMSFQRHRMHDVVAVVGSKLQEVGRYQAAGELHESMEDLQGALRAYCAGALFERARQLAGSNPTFTAYIEEQYNAYLLQNQQADELAHRGGAMASQAIDLYMQRDDWDKVHELAERQGPEAAATYAARHAERRFKQGDYGAAAQVLATHGVSAGSQFLTLYRNIASGILAAGLQDRRAEAEQELKGMLFRVVEATSAPGVSISKKDSEDCRSLYLAAHYVALSGQSKGAGLKELAAKQLTAALRYVGSCIPADRAFYEAGQAWREAGKLSMAFVMFNRFLDLSDAMEEPDSSAAVIENADFADTDIPFDFHMPQRPYVGPDQREEVRNFVLELSMDPSVEQSLASRACHQCGSQTYEASLRCHRCSAQSEPCSISGYPVMAHDRVVSRSNGFDVVAIRDCWNQWVTTFRACPVTGGPAAPLY